jgi:toxin-antitoxin system PIN domain toxin
LIAVDTNIFVYAHRGEALFHREAAEALAELVAGSVRWAVPWACLHEFFSVTTHPRVFRPPSTTAEALEALDRWLEVPNLVVLTETDVHRETLRTLVTAGQIVGPKIHDARIAAICLEHGVRELWSADRDFGRFPALKVVNPLVEQ